MKSENRKTYTLPEISKITQEFVNQLDQIVKQAKQINECYNPVALEIKEERTPEGKANKTIMQQIDENLTTISRKLGDLNGLLIDISTWTSKLP